LRHTLDVEQTDYYLDAVIPNPKWIQVFGCFSSSFPCGLLLNHLRAADQLIHKTGPTINGERKSDSTVNLKLKDQQWESFSKCF